jgi:hypothetical protein
MISATLCAALTGWLERRRWSDGSLCGISQKDGFACAFMDGAVIDAGAGNPTDAPR